MSSKTFQRIENCGADNLDSALRGVLEPGERVLWKGRPTRQKDYTAFFTWLFAIPWTGFSIFWVLATWSLSRSDPPGEEGMQIAVTLFPLFGVPFVLIGLGMMASPFFAITVPGRTLNAITDRRILRIVGGWKANLRAIPGESVISAETKEGVGSAGTLVVRYHDPEHGEAKRRVRKRGSDHEIRHLVIRHVPSVRAAARAVEEMQLNCAASSLSAGRSR